MAYIENLTRFVNRPRTTYLDADASRPPLCGVSHSDTNASSFAERGSLPHIKPSNTQKPP